MIINTYGDRSYPVVIMLHPMGFSGSQFYEQLGPHFRGKYFFVAPDMGNHGKELREFHSIEAEMSQLYIWLVKNDLRDITLLYGASMGGGRSTASVSASGSALSENLSGRGACCQIRPFDAFNLRTGTDLDA